MNQVAQWLEWLDGTPVMRILVVMIGILGLATAAYSLVLPALRKVRRARRERREARTRHRQLGEMLEGALAEHGPFEQLLKHAVSYRKLMKDVGEGDPGWYAAQYLKLRDYVLTSERLRESADAIEERKPLWKYRPFASVGHGEHRPKPQIVTVINFKGGVGKSTLTANLGAYFAVKRGLKVLVVDLDYQTSLTQVMGKLREKAGRPPRFPTVEDLVAMASPDARKAEQYAKTLSPVPIRLGVADRENTNLMAIGSTVELGSAEENQLQLWLLNHTNDDVRSRMKKVLWSDAFRDFDLILLDAPPRVTLATVNALVASTHYLVPVRPDQMSVAGAIQAIQQVSGLRTTVGSAPELAGVICNLTRRAGSLTETEAAEIQRLRGMRVEIDGETVQPRVLDTVVPDSPMVGQPLNTPLAYAQTTRDRVRVREIIDLLGQEVGVALGLKAAAAAEQADRYGLSEGDSTGASS